MNPAFIIMALIALLATVLACAWLGTVKRGQKASAKNLFSQTVFMLDSAVSYVARIGGVFRGAHVVMSNAELGIGVHDHGLTKLTEAAITTRHLLYRRGTDDLHVVVAGASDTLAPMGVIADEATAAEEEKAVLLLGKGPTKRMVASEAIVIGDEVWTAASGKVQDRTATPGTYWMVGTALTASSNDGDVIEVLDHAPVRVTVT